MSFSFIVLVVVLTAIASILFIGISNYRFLKEGLDKLSFKIVVTQLVVLTAWMTILGKTLLPLSTDKSWSSIIIFLSSIIVSALLIHHLSKEVEAKREVDKLIQKLQDSNDRLKELDKQKSEFVSLASHQLRGPLSVMQGYVSMILEGSYGVLPNDIKDPLEKVFQSGRNLGLLINDYLNATKLDKGEMEYLIEDVDITKLLNEVVNGFRVVADKSKIKLNIDYAEKDSVIIRSDINKTRQIISNLIDNSIKYTEKGSINVNYAIKGDFVTVTIKDTGIGIPKENIETIFGKFNRTKGATNMNVSGTGLGLYVAKVMTESQGGKIWAESAGVGSGSTFSVEFPLSK